MTLDLWLGSAVVASPWLLGLLAAFGAFVFGLLVGGHLERLHIKGEHRTHRVTFVIQEPKLSSAQLKQVLDALRFAHRSA